MRPLNEEETQQLFEKLHKFIGTNIKHLITRETEDGPLGSGKSGYCFRLHKQRVYYVSEVRALGRPRPVLPAFVKPKT